MNLANLSVSTLSLQKVRADISTIPAKNPTGDAVQMAVVPINTQPVTWAAASWETINGVYYASVLIGPGSTIGTLAAGRYTVFVKITDSPEIPVLAAAGILTIY